MSFVVKAGGMSNYSTIDKAGIIIDLTEWGKIRCDKTSKTAVLYGSVRAKTVAVELAKQGFCTTLPAVNAAGAIPFFLNGGNSSLVSQLGFGSDLIVGAKVVLADGRLVDVDESENSDLFYAIRGAGQFFGLITQLIIRVFTFEEALQNADGQLWAGRFVFPLDRAEEVAQVMKKIVSDANYKTSGLIMIAAPTPHFKPALAVLPRLFGSDLEALEKLAFKDLYALQPLAAGGSRIQIQDAADALDPLCRPGGFRKLSLTGLHDLIPELLVKVVSEWESMTAQHPATSASYFAFQWDSRLPKKPGFDSANGLHGVRFWANNLMSSNTSADQEAMNDHLRKVIGIWRQDQSEEGYVDFTNGLRGRTEYRYWGDRFERLKALKQRHDPSGVFSREFL